MMTDVGSAFLTISIISFKIGIFNILKDKNYSE